MFPVLFCRFYPHRSSFTLPVLVLFFWLPRKFHESPLPCVFTSLSLSVHLFLFFVSARLPSWNGLQLQIIISYFLIFFIFFLPALVSGIWVLLVNRPHFSTPVSVGSGYYQATWSSLQTPIIGMIRRAWPCLCEGLLFAPLFSLLTPAVEGWAPRWSHGGEVTAPCSDRSQTRC